MAEPSQATEATPPVADDTEWKEHVEKGAEFLSRLEKGPYGKSVWKYEDFPKEGWKQEDWNKPNKPLLGGHRPRVNLAGVLALLNASDKDKVEGGRNNYQAVILDRKRMTSSDREAVGADVTHGYIENAFNPEDGVILCHRNYKPKKFAYAGPKKPPVALFQPKLINWSDLIFPQWEHFAELANCDVRNLRYVFRSRINNEQTLKIINRAVGASPSSATQAEGDRSPGNWPGLTFKTDSDEGRALLGTPNAKGIARGMIDRPDKYRGMTIEEIQVFMDQPPASSSMHPMVCMLIRIVDRTPKQQAPQVPGPSEQMVEAKKSSKASKAFKSAKGKVKESYKEGCKGQSS